MRPTIARPRPTVNASPLSRALSGAAHLGGRTLTAGALP